MESAGGKCTSVGMIQKLSHINKREMTKNRSNRETIYKPLVGNHAKDKNLQKAIRSALGVGVFLPSRSVSVLRELR